MKTVFDGIEHSVKNWWMSLILGILYIGVAICLMFAPAKQLRSPEHCLQYFHADQWYS